MNAGVKSPRLEIVDLDPLDLPAKGLDDVGQQVVSEWAGGGIALEAPINRHRFGAADDDGEFALAIHLFEPDELLVLHLTDDDFVQFHLDGHVRAPFLFLLRLAYVRCTCGGCQ